MKKNSYWNVFFKFNLLILLLITPFCNKPIIEDFPEESETPPKHGDTLPPDSEMPPKDVVFPEDRLCDGVIPTESCQSLRLIYLTNPTQLRKTNWFTTKDACHWRTITCNENHQIISLELDGANLTTILKNSFKGFPALSMLRLSNNQIEKIEPKTFENLSQLSRLYLHGNQITDIKPKTFMGLSNLSYLSLFDNQIKSIPSESFMGLPQLQGLALANNQIETIDKTAFDTLKSLSYLDLSNNRLKGELQQDLFYQCATIPGRVETCNLKTPYLALLVLSNNLQLSSLPQVLCNDPRIHVAYINTAVTNCTH